jgi:uncharacterized small protein (DUF1192 family)
MDVIALTNEIEYLKMKVEEQEASKKEAETIWC